MDYFFLYFDLTRKGYWTLTPKISEVFTVKECKAIKHECIYKTSLQTLFIAHRNMKSKKELKKKIIDQLKYFLEKSKSNN